MQANLLTISNNLKLEADKLLNDSKLLEILSKYGDVELKGSYVLNLLLDEKDIDITVYTSTNFSLDQAIECLNEIIRSEYWESTKFKDRSKFIVRETDPKGYKIGTSRKNLDQWETDIYLVNKKTNQYKFLNETVQKLLTEEKRKVILDFKKIRKEKNIYFESYKIYDAVLIKGIYNFDEMVNRKEELDYFDQNY